MAEQIELPFGMVNGMDPRNCLLHGPAHWRHLAIRNTFERLCLVAVTGSATKSGDVTYFQITLRILFIFLSGFSNLSVHILCCGCYFY